jgi:hypothetical protein
MLVAVFMSTIVLGFSLSLIIQQRQQFLLDQARAQINQNLRAATDLLGNDIRLGGELLETDTTVPGFTVIEGSGGKSDTLVIQRKLISTILPVCEDAKAGDTTIVVSIRDDPPVSDPNCRYSSSSGGYPDNLLAWQDYREQQTPKIVAAYIQSIGKNGEFFLSDNELENTSGGKKKSTAKYSIHLDGSSLSNKYKAGVSYVYVFEERQYSLVPDSSTARSDDYVLQLLLNRGVDPQQPGRSAPPIKMVNRLTNFQVQVQLPTGLVTSFNPNYFYESNWRQVQAINVTLTALPPDSQFTADEMKRYFSDLSITSQFLPRNALSTQ